MKRWESGANKRKKQEKSRNSYSYSYVYCLFAASTSRWAILKQHVPTTVKSHSETRWESRINCIKPLRYEMSGVCDALEALEIYSTAKKDGSTATEARALLNNIATWPFIVTTVLWYDVLFQINKTSKLIQAAYATLDALHTEMNATTDFLQEYRNSGYNSACTTAREIAEALGVEREFPVLRQRRKKRQFGYEAADEGGDMSAEQKFKVEFFNKLLDQVIQSCKERFEQTKQFLEIFGFLYSADKLFDVQNRGEWRKCCGDFQQKMGDVDATELELELERFVTILRSDAGHDLKNPTHFLNYIYKNSLQECYPNLAISLRILLTVPVSVSSGERSFSKLKLIKTFNRSTMKDDRLSDLAMISIEHETARDLDYTSLINSFSEAKARHKPL